MTPARLVGVCLGVLALAAALLLVVLPAQDGSVDCGSLLTPNQEDHGPLWHDNCQQERQFRRNLAIACALGGAAALTLSVRQPAST